MAELYPVVVMYHYVREPGTPPSVGYPAVSPRVFTAQLDELCRRGTPLAWPDLVDWLEGRRALPDDGFVLTFDDGLIDHHRTVLPELTRRRLPGIFFVLAREPRDGLTVAHRLHVLLGVMDGNELGDAVAEAMAPAVGRRYRNLVADAVARAGDDASTVDPADPWKRPLQRELVSEAAPILATLVRHRVGPEDELARELYLGAADVAELAAEGFTVGGHGRDHLWLDAVGGPIRRAEVAAAAKLVAEHGPPPWPFAYPYGAVPPGPARLLTPAGFAAAFTTRRGERRGPFRIGRLDADEWAATAGAEPPGG